MIALSRGPAFSGIALSRQLVRHKNRAPIKVGRRSPREDFPLVCVCDGPAAIQVATLACPSRRHASRRILRSVFTIATTGSVSACASVAGLRNSTLGCVVISVVSVLTIRLLAGARDFWCFFLCLPFIVPLTKVLEPQPRSVGCLALI
jgi:hypothetical protein